jgi:hypothetical protein
MSATLNLQTSILKPQASIELYVAVILHTPYSIAYSTILSLEQSKEDVVGSPTRIKTKTKTKTRTSTPLLRTATTLHTVPYCPPDGQGAVLS